MQFFARCLTVAATLAAVLVSFRLLGNAFPWLTPAPDIQTPWEALAELGRLFLFFLDIAFFAMFFDLFVPR